MSYGLRATLTVVWLGDGAGPMSVPSAQKLVLPFGNPGGSAIVPVPGGNAPSAANFNTAIDALTVQEKAAVLANLGQIQGFATGGG